jgi:integrating conjugative element protein (TIGR03761 family)
MDKQFQVSGESRMVLNKNDLIQDDHPEIKLAEEKTKYFKQRQNMNWNQKGVSETEAGIDAINMVPGPMQMKAKIKLHTKLAINLFRGRKGDPERDVRGIVGLARFARQAAMVWSAAAIDDPYADMCLLDVEHAYEDAEKIIDARAKTLENLLNGLEDFEIETQASVEPVVIDLEFFSPWGYRGALLLRKLDQMIRLALTARHVGLIMNDDWNRIVSDSLRAVRHTFAQITGWTHTAVNRADIRANNKVAKRAKQRYLELKRGYLVVNEDILNGAVRARMSPSNKIEETAKRVKVAQDVAKRKLIKIEKESEELER